MAGNKLSYETCVTIWELVSSGAKGSAVAKAMGVTAQTVSRINTIFSAVRDGKVAEMSDSTAAFTYYIEYANKYFTPPKKSVRAVGERRMQRYCRNLRKTERCFLRHYSNEQTFRENA